MRLSTAIFPLLLGTLVTSKEGTLCSFETGGLTLVKMVTSDFSWCTLRKV